MIRPNKVVPQIRVYDLSLYDKDRSFFNISFSTCCLLCLKSERSKDGKLQYLPAELFDRQ